MAVFVDFEDEPVEPPDSRRTERPNRYAHRGQGEYMGKGYTFVGKQLVAKNERSNPNINVMSEALGCYPYVQVYCTSYIILIFYQNNHFHSCPP